jgi:hypothetical protein
VWCAGEDFACGAVAEFACGAVAEFASAASSRSRLSSSAANAVCSQVICPELLNCWCRKATTQGAYGERNKCIAGEPSKKRCREAICMDVEYWPGRVKRLTWHGMHSLYLARLLGSGIECSWAGKIKGFCDNRALFGVDQPPLSRLACGV